MFISRERYLELLRSNAARLYWQAGLEYPNLVVHEYRMDGSGELALMEMQGAECSTYWMEPGVLD